MAALALSDKWYTLAGAKSNFSAQEACKKMMFLKRKCQGSLEYTAKVLANALQVGKTIDRLCK